MYETACFPKPSSLLVIALLQKVAIAGQAQKGLHSENSPAIQSNRITQVLAFFKHYKRDRSPDHNYAFKKSSFLLHPIFFMHYRCPGAPNSALLAPTLSCSLSFEELFQLLLPTQLVCTCACVCACMRACPLNPAHSQIFHPKILKELHWQGKTLLRWWERTKLHRKIQQWVVRGKL